MRMAILFKSIPTIMANLKTSPLNQKQQLRQIMTQVRKAIPPARKHEAENKALNLFSNYFEAFSLVLSYASFGSEFNTWKINQLIVEQNKLVLPRIQGDSLRLFHVRDLKAELKQNSWGVFEPDPQICKEIAPSEISLALIPGLAFDKAHQRLGYGKGYYDRLLPQFLKTTSIDGLGFLEQFVTAFLPKTPLDKPLQKVRLF
jgi:5-formyltetrahydrofolate cyclo-ligase